MKNKTRETRTCYLIGGKSLLIQCAQVLQENHFDIQAVVSDSPELLDWAKSLNLKTYSVDRIETLIADGPVDYIFSITHLEIIPSTVLALAEKRAINFHDGPLPEYAGLNVTSWAIYNFEHKHAVTWHEMTDKIDRGNILSEVLIDISENETAFTLNIKCYAAALDSFCDLIRKLNDDQLVGTPQKSGKSKLFKRCDRMPAMGVIDWNQPSKKIHAMVRSLIFGSYSNPVNIPKLLVKDKIYYVQETEIVEASSIKPGNVIETSSIRPGTVLVEGEYPVISTMDSYIRIMKAVDENGNSVLPALDLVEGSVLNDLSSDQKARLEAWDQRACTHENYWLKTLCNVEQLNLPYLTAKPVKSENNYSSTKQLIDKQFLGKLSIFSDEGIQSLLTIFLARICNVAAFSLFFNFEEKNEIQNLFYKMRVPVNFSFDYQNNIAELIEYSHNKISKVASIQGYARELSLREPNFPTLEKPVVLLDFERETLSTPLADLAILVNYESCQITWQYRTELFSEAAINRFVSHFSAFIDNLIEFQDVSVAEVGLISKKELQLIDEWNGNNKPIDTDACMHHLFEQQVIEQPEAPAVSFAGEEFDYSTLNRRANKVAHYLLENRVQPDQLVAVLLDRSIDMLVAMLGILKSGAAYLPLDPDYPKDRIVYMLQDSQAVQVITESKYQSDIGQNVTSSLEIDVVVLDDYPDYNPNVNTQPSSLAYTIYTSGSTGKPKGVMVEHRNVINFFSGMDDVIQATNGVWLAVTSISFDISVLELFWTLSNGFKVVLFSDSLQKDSRKLMTRYPDKDMKFSMFYWNVADSEHDYDVQPYRLLLESAKYADRNDFEAVWTPERHFHAFGGLYPNPAITSSALATVTDSIHLRAGSCVVPLHHPARIAEEWAVVDNLSNGRVGISIAAGWQPNDFLLMPQNHENAKNIMFENLGVIQKLWRGDAVIFDGPNGPVETRTLPRPKQKELPIWVTTAGNPETFRMAGEYGANILTHLLGQSVDGVAENIEIYRQAYRDSGHEGEGYVTLLLHTLIGDDENKVKDLAREPMKKYLKSAMFLVKAAAWHFPTFKRLSEETGQNLDEYFENISDGDLDSLLEFAFERYYKESGLFGTPERALGMVDRLKEIGVNEIGCLIDYGMDTDSVLDHLPGLNELRKISIKQPKTVDSANTSIPELINRHEVTHLQCTPSMANMLISDPNSSTSLGKLRHIMVGGEAFPSGLSKELSKLIGTRVTNMYGPTETTIWSTTLDVTKEMDTVPIGRPICNTEVYILDQCNQPFPHGISGELCIGGSGVVRGYHNRAELTDERFIPDTFKKNTASRLYRTGDLARYGDGGIIEYLGRLDHQIKIRGYRIELGEIESLLEKHEDVNEAVVLLREDKPGDKRLVAYMTQKSGCSLQTSELKGYLLLSLPEFMVPVSYVLLHELPLTPNGKLDRKALPEPDIVRISKVEYVSPETALEIEVAQIWCEVLEIAEVGMNDNFFDLGGHSLTAVQVAHDIRQKFNIEFPLQTMFQKTTLYELTETVEHMLLEHADDDEIEALLSELEGMSDEEAASSARSVDL